MFCRKEAFRIISSKYYSRNIQAKKTVHSLLLKTYLSSTAKVPGNISINSENRKYHEAQSQGFKKVQRIWLPLDTNEESSNDDGGESMKERAPLFWNRAVDEDLSSMRGVIDRVGIQEREGGRMKQKKLGVLHEDPQEDMRLLIENYTVPSLASALRDREDVLQLCATLLADGKMDELETILKPFEQKYVEMKRAKRYNLDLVNGFETNSLELLRKGLNQMPRRVTQAHQKRAGVVVPLCNVDGVPSILFEKRSANLRAHADEVCFPGGMVSSDIDRSIIETCLREMHEEIKGIDRRKIRTLGVLRCNWGEVHHLVGVAVTPVVCYIGEIGNIDLRPSADEVAQCFTVPLSSFLDRNR